MPGHCERLCELDVSSLISWVTAIDFAEWPQQHRVDHQLRPAMVTDLEWYGFGERTDAVVQNIATRMGGETRGLRALSVVMPGHSIHRHRDEQPGDWVTRVHVPLTTNEGARMVFDAPYHLEVGWAYTVDTRGWHAVENRGASPRVHLMFDVVRS